MLRSSDDLGMAAEQAVVDALTHREPVAAWALESIQLGHRGFHESPIDFAEQLRGYFGVAATRVLQ